MNRIFKCIGFSVIILLSLFSRSNLESSEVIDSSILQEDGKDLSSVDMNTLQREIEKLGEELFKSNTHLKLIRDRINIDSSASAHVQIFHRNLVSERYKLFSAHYYLDGLEIYQEIFEKGVEVRDKPKYVFEASILPGSHNLQMEMIFESKGSLFSSKKYTFKVLSQFSFVAEEGEFLKINAISYEEKNPKADQRKTLKVRFEKED